MKTGSASISQVSGDERRELRGARNGDVEAEFDFCPDCDRKYLRSTNGIFFHMKAKHNRANFTCLECGDKFLYCKDYAGSRNVFTSLPQNLYTILEWNEADLRNILPHPKP